MADTLQPTQQCILIVGAASPPTPVQIGGMTGTPPAPKGNGPVTGMMTLYVVNTDASNIAYLAYGATSAAATAAAVVPTTNAPQYVVPIHPSSGNGTMLQFPAGTWFTVVSSAGTPNTLIVPGNYATS